MRKSPEDWKTFLFSHIVDMDISPSVKPRPRPASPRLHTHTHKHTHARTHTHTHTYGRQSTKKYCFCFTNICRVPPCPLQPSESFCLKRDRLCNPGAEKKKICDYAVWPRHPAREDEGGRGRIPALLRYKRDHVQGTEHLDARQVCQGRLTRRIAPYSTDRGVLLVCVCVCV